MATAYANYSVFNTSDELVQIREYKTLDNPFTPLPAGMVVGIYLRCGQRFEICEGKKKVAILWTNVDGWIYKVKNYNPHRFIKVVYVKVFVSASMSAETKAFNTSLLSRGIDYMPAIFVCKETIGKECIPIPEGSIAINI